MPLLMGRITTAPQREMSQKVRGLAEMSCRINAGSEVNGEKKSKKVPRAVTWA